MTDYWLSKLFYDLLQPSAAADWRADRLAVLARYPLDPRLRQAVVDDDIAQLAPHVNAYLLRFYYGVCGLSDDELIRRLRTLPEEEGDGHG